MNLVVCDSELTETSSKTVADIEAVVGLGNQFVARLEKLMKIGYVSENMTEALTERCKAVRAALASLDEARQPMAKTVKSFINAIDSIDRL